MTREFDEKARVDLASGNVPWPVFNGGEVKPRDLVVRPITVKQARPYIASFHYSRTMPDATKECTAGFYGDRIAGIMVFGMGASKSIFTRIDPDVQHGEYRELTRGWVADEAPKNTNTRLISQAIKKLPKKVRFVVSFADEGRGHLGTVYQAANFEKDGYSEGGTGQRLFDENGHEVHPRLLHIYRIRHPTKYGDMKGPEIAKSLGWTLEKTGRSRKVRYIFHRYRRGKWGQEPKRQAQETLVARETVEEEE